MNFNRRTALALGVAAAVGPAMAATQPDPIGRWTVVNALGGLNDPNHPFVDDLRGPNQFRKLAGLLAARGHKTARIEKILGGNFVRYARDIWGA